MAGGWMAAGRMSGESFHTCNISCISWDKVVTWHCSLAMAVLEGVVGTIGLGLELGLSFSHCEAPPHSSSVTTDQSDTM